MLADGAIQASYRKLHLPNYGVFDELRYFQPGERGATIDIDGVTVGLTICEDIWQPGQPLSDEALSGARVIVNLSASPYDAGKGERRERMLQQRARDDLAAVAFCALVGGQDELVFDGRSVVIDHQGTVLARAPQFEETLLLAEIDPVTVGSARLRDTRRRAPAAAARGRVDQLGSFTVGRREPTRDGRSQATIARDARARRGGLRRARARHARLRAQERLRARRARPERRDRLDARRAHRRRRARARPRHLRDDAVAVLVAGNARRRARGSPRTSAARCSSCRSSR